LDRTRSRGPDEIERRGQERATIRLVSDAIRLDEPERLGRLQAVAFDGPEDRVLVLVGQAAEVVRERRTDRSSSELVVGERRQSCGQREAAGGPVLAVAEQPGDAPRRHAVVFDERADDPGLVESRYGARGRIGLEEQPFLLDRRRRGLDEDSNDVVALLAPAREALESVQDFVAVGAAACDSDGEIGRLPRATAQPARSKGRPTGGQRIDRYKADTALDRRGPGARR
jgi:hypothetical protein